MIVATHLGGDTRLSLEPVHIGSLAGGVVVYSAPQLLLDFLVVVRLLPQVAERLQVVVLRLESHKQELFSIARVPVF